MRPGWKLLAFSAASVLLELALLIALALGWATKNGIVVW